MSDVTCIDYSSFGGGRCGEGFVKGTRATGQPDLASPDIDLPKLF